MSLGERMTAVFAGSLLAKLLPRGLFGDRCSRKAVEGRVEREVRLPRGCVDCIHFQPTSGAATLLGERARRAPTAGNAAAASTPLPRPGQGRERQDLNAGTLHRAQVSHASLLRLYRCKRCQPPADSLLALAAAAAAAHFDAIASDALAALPPDCAQLVLDALVAAGELTFKRLARFGGQSVYRLDLAEFPDFKPEWLRLLRHAPLCTVSLRNCELVRAQCYHR